ncbi:helix-turn-helix domain-containing protein [Natronobiforma cellulositropha]|uniref:helix-turn-helix domain-containing protein n=1 Tax=Natronobiforma cellulositropha TaxID=1679076 RepID=UPI0021D5AC12|nr:helix-turn-helix domain-containing protein [Natronobiforma cellulositropha]
MASDDTNDERVDDADDSRVGDGEDEEIPVHVEQPDDADGHPREGVGAAVEEIDGRIVDVLAWILDTETRAKIYVYLLANPASTSEEVAKGTGLYPSTVREALAELHDEERVSRHKRASEGAGNNPYEYTAIQPSELVGGVVDQIQHELNTVFTLDRLLERRTEDDAFGEDVEPVRITVDDVSSEESVDGSSDDGSGGPDEEDGSDEDDGPGP